MKRFSEIENLKNTILKEGPVTSMKDVLLRTAKYCPNNKVIGTLGSNKNVIYHTSIDLLKDVEAIGEGLIDLGLENKHICICAENSYMYLICDIAVAIGVGVITPIDVGAPTELLSVLLPKCDCEAIICSSSVLKRIEAVKESYSSLKTIITIDKKIEGYPFIEDVMNKGEKLVSKGYFINKELDVDALSELLFTSGTTGANKAVMLTQRNLGANIMNCLELMKAKNSNETNTSMSVLPMHHATEINTHIMARVAAGRLTYINSSMKEMMANIKIFKPYCITIVPMIANAFYKTIWQEAKKAGMDKKLKTGIKITNLLKKFGKDKTHKLFKDVFVPFGGNLDQITCGGAMLSPEVVKGLSDLGIYTVNGYGITECGPLCSMNTDMRYPYSVGKTPSLLEAKLFNEDDNGVGELCFKGPSVSKGYYKDDVATQKSFDEDGYFHTGDLARIDKAGRIFMTGRKINAIILENGKNVCPEEVEAIIQEHIPYLNDVVVYSVKKKGVSGEHEMLVCGIYIEDETLRKDRTKIANDFKEVNKLLPVYEHIVYVNMPETEYEKTALRKIKRKFILEKHNDKTGINL